MCLEVNKNKQNTLGFSVVTANSVVGPNETFPQSCRYEFRCKQHESCAIENEQDYQNTNEDGRGRAKGEGKQQLKSLQSKNILIVAANILFNVLFPLFLLFHTHTATHISVYILNIALV